MLSGTLILMALILLMWSTSSCYWRALIRFGRKHSFKESKVNAMSAKNYQDIFLKLIKAQKISSASSKKNIKNVYLSGSRVLLYL